MSDDLARQQSNPEVVFVLMKALVAGHLLWGVEGALPLDTLRALLRADSSRIARALQYLRQNGIVRVDRRRGLVHLTESAARDLLR
jgi:hypothetical protein